MHFKMLLILHCCVIAVFFIKGTMTYDPESSITGLYTGPYFDPLAKKNLSAHLGEQATLPCTVRQLGDKSVSWVRMRDADILTVDRYTFVGDERFESHFSETRETWSLIIKYVQERDAGLYECQVSTEPKMSQLFNLRVVVPKVGMVPPGDRFMKAGSRVQIDCYISNVVEMPDYIFWYKGDVRIMEKKDPNVLITMKRTGAEAITSTLTILDVPAEASGNYTCMPSNLHSASVTLHVLNEEKNPEAMQGERNGAPTTTRDSGAHHHSHSLPLLLLLLLGLLLWASWWSPSSPLYANEANQKTEKEGAFPLRGDGDSSPSSPPSSSSSSPSASIWLFLTLYSRGLAYPPPPPPPLSAYPLSYPIAGPYSRAPEAPTSQMPKHKAISSLIPTFSLPIPLSFVPISFFPSSHSFEGNLNQGKEETTGFSSFGFSSFSRASRAHTPSEVDASG